MEQVGRADFKLSAWVRDACQKGKAAPALLVRLRVKRAGGAAKSDEASNAPSRFACTPHSSLTYFSTARLRVYEQPSISD